MATGARRGGAISPYGGARRDSGAFSLIELMVACGILALILGVMLSMINQTAGIWRSSNARIEAFQGARRGFDTLTTLLSQASLNTYWGYDDENNPSNYVRKSELHFVVAPAGSPGIPGTPGCGQGIFFQAPAVMAKDSAYEKLSGLLNHCGFYVEYGSDAAWLPGDPINAPARSRHRLMLWLANTDVAQEGGEKPLIYRSKDDTTDGTSWISPRASDAYPLADNIIALIVWPREESGSNVLNAYAYNSRAGLDDNPQPITANQLPPILEVAMVAIDEPSAHRLGQDLPDVISSCLAGLFDEDPAADFVEDMKTLESRLTERRITYRVFTSAVPLREGKWSPL